MAMGGMSVKQGSKWHSEDFQVDSLVADVRTLYQPPGQ